MLCLCNVCAATIRRSAILQAETRGKAYCHHIMGSSVMSALLSSTTEKDSVGAMFELCKCYDARGKYYVAARNKG